MARAAPAAAPDAGGGKKKIILIAAIALVVLIGGGVGAALLLTGGHKGGEKAAAEAEGKAGAEGAKAEATYTALEPAFVVNFQDRNNRTKYLKADLSVVSAVPKSEEIIRKHLPAIRNGLIMLLSRQVFEDLQTPDGKEKLRAEALKEVQAILTKQTGKPVVDDLFFSSFVMQ